MTARPLILAPFALAALALLPAAVPQRGGGASLYKQRCQSCHAVGPGAASPMGPNLAGVIGRKAGAADYRYSPALKAAGITWTRASLDTYLAGPTKMVPGTRMAVTVADAGQRAELITYLETTR
jgi:cytochrome c